MKHMTITTIICATMLLFASLSPGQILVNECFLGGTDWLEILNAGPTTVSVAGYQVLVSGDSANGPVVNTFTFPAGATIASGEAVVVTEDAAQNFPSVQPGTQVFYYGGNIWWSGFGSGFGGVCTVTNGSQGLDTVNWVNPLNANPVGPATFNGSITTLNGDHIFRININSPSSPADWSSAANGSAGTLNPGQQIGPSPLDISLVQPVPGALDILVTTTPAVPGGEIYNLFSLTAASPLGSGPLFGLSMDAFPQVFSPMTPAGPFHTSLNGAGQWSRSFTVAVPPNLHVEAVSILLQGQAITRISQISTLDT